jgi:N12 class adenine-specific DNA methylase
LEGVWETMLGAGAIGRAFKGIISRGLKEGGEELAKANGKKFITDIWAKTLEKTPALAPLGEGIEELGTQISQNAVDKYSGYRPNIKLTEGAGDAMLLGIGQGTVMSGGLYTARKLTEPSEHANTPEVLDAITSGDQVDLLDTPGSKAGPASGQATHDPTASPEPAPAGEPVATPAPQPGPPADFSGLTPEEMAEGLGLHANVPGMPEQVVEPADSGQETMVPEPEAFDAVPEQQTSEATIPEPARPQATEQTAPPQAAGLRVPSPVVEQPASVPFEDWELDLMASALEPTVEPGIPGTTLMGMPANQAPDVRPAQDAQPVHEMPAAQDVPPVQTVAPVQNAQPEPPQVSRPVIPDGVRVKSDGTPYTEKGARVAAKGKSRGQKLFEPVEVEGGWGIKEKEAQEKAARAMDTDGRPLDKKAIFPGDTFRTTSGRETTPFPKTSKAQHKGDQKKTDQWLIDNALAEAEARQDKFNAAQFSGETAGNLPPASVEAMNEYLFGQQPDVLRPVTRPLVHDIEKESSPDLTEKNDLVQRVESSEDSLAEFMKIGGELFPDLRLQEHEEAGRWAYMVAKGEASQEDFDATIEQWKRENRFVKAPAAEPDEVAEIVQEDAETPQSGEPVILSPQEATAEDMLAEWDRQEAAETLPDVAASRPATHPAVAPEQPKTQAVDTSSMTEDELVDYWAKHIGEGADPEADPEAVWNSGLTEDEKALVAGQDQAASKKESAKGHVKAAADLMGQVSDILAGSVGLSTKIVKEGDNVDQGVYSQIKPLLQQAFDHLVAAGKDMAEYVSMARKMLNGPNGRAYFRKFVTEDLVRAGDQAGKEAEDGDNVSGTGVSKDGQSLREDHPTAQEQSHRPSQGVASQGVQASANDGAAPAGDRTAGKRGKSGDRPADAKGVSKPRGRRDRPAPVHPADAGEIVRDDYSPSGVTGANFQITDEVRLGQGSERVKYNDNIAAIKVLRQLEAEKRPATPDEQRTLARYVGWGGLANAFRVSGTGRVAKGWEDRVAEVESLLTQDELKAARSSTRNAHYTSPDVVDAMWKAVQHLGFSGGSVLEPSMGSGNFLGMAPSELAPHVDFLGVEYDSITARIAKHLYPQSAIFHSGFEKLPVPSGAVDLVLGNPPFGKDRLRFLHNPDLNPYTIHNQFFLAGIDALAPGGIQLMVVSRYFLDAQDSMVRQKIAEKARLLGAVRLPETAFRENARTDVVTDIIVLQKHDNIEQTSVDKAIAEKKYLAPEWVETALIADPLGGDPMRVGRYFADHPRAVVGEMDRSGSMQHGADITVKYTGDDFAGELWDTLRKQLPKDVLDQASRDRATDREAFTRMVDSLAIYMEGAEQGSVTMNAQGDMVHVYDTETSSGDHILARRVLSKDSPWSNRLAMDDKGRWFEIVDELDDQGKPVKMAKGSRRNKKIRKIYRTEGEVPVSLRLGAAGFDRLRAAVVLRDCLIKQLDLESVGEGDDKAIAANRSRLNSLYDDYVTKHGCLNGNRTSKVTAGLPNRALLTSLEKNYSPPVTPYRAKKSGKDVAPESADKADIFSRRVVDVYAPPQSAKSEYDALAISLSERGRVDIDRVAGLLGVDRKGAVRMLHTDKETPLIFKDPVTGVWETADEYLGGNVVKKLEAAREAGAHKNAEALEKIQPEPWTADQVTPVMGGTWIAPKDYASFLEKLTGNPATVMFSRHTNTYAVSGDAASAQALLWGTERVDVVKLVDAILNSRSIKVRDTWTENGVSRSAVNVEATEAAVAKAREIETEFESWVFEDSERRKRLVDEFNRRFNVMVNKQRNGQHLEMPGKVPDAVITMRRHQKNGIWRGICDRFVLYDHAVGAGKTFTGIGRAMERKRMGLSRKPMIVVPNHMVEQFASDVFCLYPNARLLAAGKKDFSPANRRRLFASIATGDWDLVIVPHSSFGFIGISPATEERFLQEELDLAAAAIKEAEEEAKQNGEGGRFKPVTVKQAERVYDALLRRMEKVRAKSANKDRLLTFEQMGVDDLTVDESHEFKNLFYYSNLNVRGMNPKEGSGKAYDLFNKVRLLRETKTGSVCFMTGTPISNSAVEMYGILRYLALDELESLGLAHFDAWRSQYVSVTTEFEPTESGSGLKEVNRLGRDWSNMRSLMDLYYSVADCVSNEDIQKWYLEDNGAAYPLPGIKGGGRQAINVPPTPAQQRIIDEIVGGFESLGSITDIKARNAERLRLMDRARKVSLDAREADPRVQSDEKGGKLDVVADNIARIYAAWEKDRGTQLVFLDRSVPRSKGKKAQEDKKRIALYDRLMAQVEAAEMDGDQEALRRLYDQLEGFDPNEIEAVRRAQLGGWNGYEQIKQNLIERGIPAREIRFIQDAATDEQKQAIFDDVKDGVIRVLIGSSARMGAGTNVQDRLVALHHVDVTWKPSDIEQREGRIIRPGNKLLEKYGDDFEIEIIPYTTDTTIDAKFWALNSTKLKMINGIRHYDGAFNMEFDDTDSVGMAEIAAIASGEPLQLERIKLSAEIDKLIRARQSFLRRTWGIKDRLETAKRRIRELPAKIDVLQRAVKDIAGTMESEQQDAAKRSVNVGSATLALAIDTQGASVGEIADAITAPGNGPATTLRVNLSDVAAAFDAISDRATEDGARFKVDVGGNVFRSKKKAAEKVREILGTPGFTVTLSGETYINPQEAREALSKRIASHFPESPSELGEVEISEGVIHGQRITVSMSISKRSKGYYDLELYLESEVGGGYHMQSEEVYTLHKDSWGAPVLRVNPFRKLADRISGARLDLGRHTRELAEARADVGDLGAEAAKEFPDAEALDEKKARLDEVERELSANASKAAKSDSAGSDSESPRYLKTTGQASGVPVDECRAEVDIVRPLLSEDLGVEVVEDIEHLPVAVLADMVEKDATGSPSLFDPDTRTIYVIAENIDAVDQVHTECLHHEMTHAGLWVLRERARALGGSARTTADNVNRMLDRLFREREAEITAMVTKGRWEGLFDTSTRKGRIQAAEEWLAEHDKGAGKWYDRYVAALSRMLRAVARALKLNPKPYTEAEVRVLLRDVFDAVKEGVGEGKASPVTVGMKKAIAYLTAFHGTPHRGIEQFSTDKIGTGEGNQVYGWGLYFATKKDVAEWYRKGITSRQTVGVLESIRSLTPSQYNSAAEKLQLKDWDIYSKDEWLEDIEVRDDPSDIEEWKRGLEDLGLLSDEAMGQLYEVEIPEDSEMLLWDDEISEQRMIDLYDRMQQTDAFSFAEAFQESWYNRQEKGHGNWDGQDLYTELSKDRGSDKSASKLLNSIGIKGIKYLDGSSRGAGEGTYNYVIFDGADTEIKQVYYSRRRRGETSTRRPASLFPEVQERIDAAHGVKPLSFVEKWTERLTTAKHVLTRHFEHLSPRKFGNVISILRESEAIPTVSVNWAADRLREILGGLSRNEYDVFSMSLVLPDMIKDVESGLLDEGDLPFGYASLEDVRADLEHFESMQSNKVQQALAARLAIMAELRQSLVKNKILSKEILKDDRYFHHQVLQHMAAGKSAGTGSKDAKVRWRGWKSGRKGSALDYNTDYLQAEFEILSQGRADVLKAEALKEIRAACDVSGKLKKKARALNLEAFYNVAGVPVEDRKTKRDPLTKYRQTIAMNFRGLSKKAERGELFAPPEFLEVLEALADAEHDQQEADMVESGIGVEVNHPGLWNYLAYLAQRDDMAGSVEARTIFKAVHNREARIKNTLGKGYRKFSDIVPKGHVVWSPAVKSPMFKAPTVPERIMQQIMSGARVEIGQGDITEMWVRGMRELWVLPEEVAAQLDEPVKGSEHGLGKLDRDILNAWKQWTLLNPFRALKYNLNNTSGDMDIAMAYDPRILTYAVRSARDLHAWMKKKELPANLQREIEDAVKHDIIGSGLTVQEIPDISQAMTTDRMLGDLIQNKKPGVISRYWRTTKDYTMWRENILRLAAYRYFQDRVRRGETVYGASVHEKIAAIKDPDRKAATLARELIGDYGNLTVAGQWIRRHMIPFYSWMEINLPRYVRMIRNLPLEGRGSGRAARVAGWHVAKGGSKLALKAFILYGAVQLWNAMFFPDEDDELNRAGRGQVHLVLGRRDDGSIVSFRFQGALTDALSWFGVENPVSTLRQMAAGVKDARDLLDDFLKAAPNRLILSARPFAKTAGELLTGTQLYPDATNPRPVRDKMEHASRILSLEKLYRLIEGRPQPGETVAGKLGRVAESLVTYSTDPGEAAYWAVRGDMYKWLRRHDVEMGGSQPTRKGNALYWYKQAIRYGDVEAAARYWKKYQDLGGTQMGAARSVRMADPRRVPPGVAKRHYYQWYKELTPEKRKLMDQAVTWYNDVYHSTPNK